MKKVVDEEHLFKDIRENGFNRGHPTFQELLVIAKYIRQEHGYGQKNIIRELIIFCKDRDKYFNPILSESLLERVARSAVQNSNFRKPNFPINITQKELDKIRIVKDYAIQKILFSAMVVAKSSGKPFIFSDSKKNILYIISLSGQRLSHDRFVRDVSPIARAAGIFEHVLGRHSFYKLLVSDDNNNAVLRILSLDEMDSAGHLYENFVGGVLEWCTTCGSEFFKLSNNHKLCSDCSSEREKEKGRERVRASRNKKKLSNSGKM